MIDFRFLAEVFNLSDDHLQWLKIYPKMLSITVKQKKNKNSHNPIIELNAADLEQQKSFSLPVSAGFFYFYINFIFFFKLIFRRKILSLFKSFCLLESK